MRGISAILLCLLFAATEVLASIRAGPYEALFVYYAYRMEWDRNVGGRHRTNLVPRCSGRVRTTPCTFDEFVAAVYRGRGSAGRYRGGFDPDDIRRYPTIDDAADALKNRYNFQHVSMNLNEVYINTGGFLRQIRQATKTIQDCRLAARPRDPMYLATCRNALLGVIEARQADNAEGIWRDLRARFNGMTHPGSPTLPPPKSTYTPGGGTFDEYDEIATEREIARAEGLGHENNPGNSPAVVRWRTEVAQIRGSQVVQDHVNIYTNFQDRYNRIRGNNLGIC